MATNWNFFPHLEISRHSLNVLFVIIVSLSFHSLSFVIVGEWQWISRDKEEYFSLARQSFSHSFFDSQMDDSIGNTFDPIWYLLPCLGHFFERSKPLDWLQFHHIHPSHPSSFHSHPSHFTYTTTEFHSSSLNLYPFSHFVSSLFSFFSRWNKISFWVQMRINNTVFRQWKWRVEIEEETYYSFLPCRSLLSIFLSPNKSIFVLLPWEWLEEMDR